MKWFLLLAIACSTLSAKELDPSLEESLELKRITEYWKEKDYATVKIQIRHFLSKNLKSAHADSLYAMLGDLYFQEKNFSEAAAVYGKILSPELRRKCLFQHLHCLYETERGEEFIAASDLFLQAPEAKTEQIDTVRFELAEIYFHKAHAPENAAKKKELLSAALAEYQSVMQSKYADRALLPLAQTYAFLDEYAKASALYLLLAYKDAARKEEYLFQAASLQLHDNKPAAIETYGRIYEMNGKHASKAAFNQLNLLFQEKKYREFILAKEGANKYIAEEKLPWIEYAFGRSLFLTGDFERAILPLSHGLLSKSLDRAQEKTALLSLIACARHTRDLPLFEKHLAALKALFPDDSGTKGALLMHAQLCRENKEWLKARCDIQDLLEIDPKHPDREALLYDTAQILAQEEKWQESASAFEAFLKEFPQSIHRGNALRYYVSCRLEDVKRASFETERVKKEQLLAALSTAIAEKRAFVPSERQKIRYLLGKMHYELSQYDEAIVHFSDYVANFQGDPSCADAALMLAYSYRNGGQDEIHFALNAEKALSLNPQIPGALDLHLTLFNTYLGLAARATSAEKGEMIAKAADHLFLAREKAQSLDNLRWLAQFYGQAGDRERTSIVLEKLIGSEKIPQLATEGESVKLGEVYGKMGRLVDRARLFEALCREQKEHPELPWKYQRMAQFELGKTYLSLGERNKALSVFEELIATSSHITSYFAVAAQVEAAKLQFSQLREKGMQEDATAMGTLFDTLKDIQIKRKLHSEPLHLEAALCYAEMKAELAPLDERNSRKRFLLEQMKENFTSGEDPLVKHYFSAAAQFPEKEKLCRQYLAFIDAEMLRLEAEEKQSASLQQAAKAQLDQLLKESIHESLSERIGRITWNNAL